MTSFDRWIVSDALLSLSVEHRVAVVRACCRGQTVADIAAHEGIPEDTVKARLHEAMRSLQISMSSAGQTSHWP
jgi:RNA polymerase sigma-70 factor (ECF subfamily)